jgi:hypothetical protein
LKAFSSAKKKQQSHLHLLLVSAPQAGQQSSAASFGSATLSAFPRLGIGNKILLRSTKKVPGTPADILLSIADISGFKQ